MIVNGPAIDSGPINSIYGYNEGASNGDNVSDLVANSGISDLSYAVSLFSDYTDAMGSYKIFL